MNSRLPECGFAGWIRRLRRETSKLGLLHCTAGIYRPLMVSDPFHCSIVPSSSHLSSSRPPGFTIVELMAAATMLVIVVTLALYGFIYALKENARAMVQNELDMDVQASMENLKKDLRLSALEKMFFYPPGTGLFEAISFPLAYADSNGLVALDSSNKVVWDEQVIYHKWKTSPNQLRRTSFRPRPSLTNDLQWLEQLTYVVTNGCATNKTGTAGTHGWTNAAGAICVRTDVMFENLFDWSVTPQAGVYDGYDVATNREAANLGSCILSNGAHTFTFTVVGSNALSTGYNIGLDTLIVSPNAMNREAELQISASSANPTNMLMDKVGSWSHNRQLYFAAAATGAWFNLVMTNDCWEETTFRGTGQVFDDTKLIWDTNKATLDYLVTLDGNLGDPDQLGWYAKKQTQTGNGPDTNLIAGILMGGELDNQPTLTNCAVRVLIRGEDMEFGRCIPFNSGRKMAVWFCSGAGQLVIDNAYIAECASTNTISPDATGSGILFVGGPWTIAASNAVALTNSDYSIDKGKSYLVSFRVSGTNGYARSWLEQNDPASNGCWILPGASADETRAANWSGNTNLIVTNRLYGVGLLFEYMPTNGYFASAVCDTKSGVSTCTVSWTHSTNLLPYVSDPGGCSGCPIYMQVRAGNSNDLSDAPAWSNVATIASVTSTNLGGRRYVQFRARLGVCGGGGGKHYNRLHHVRMAWNGPTQYVDIGGTFTKAPDYGIWKLTVDGQPLIGGITVNLEIFQDVYTRTGMRKVTSALTSEITPRNSGK